MRHAKIVTINVGKTVSDRFVATSPDIIGLHVIADDEETLKELACEMICDLYEASGQRVSVYESDDQSHMPPPWVIVPAQSDGAVC